MRKRVSTARWVNSHIRKITRGSKKPSFPEKTGKREKTGKAQLLNRRDAELHSTLLLGRLTAQTRVSQHTASHLQSLAKHLPHLSGDCFGDLVNHTIPSVGTNPISLGSPLLTSQANDCLRPRLSLGCCFSPPAPDTKGIATPTRDGTPARSSQRIVRGH